MPSNDQLSFSTNGFDVYRRPTRRSKFLAEMERAVPWKQLCGLIKPYYPTGEGGRPSVPLERMLRMYLVQQWFNLSDQAAEDELIDSISMRDFAHVDLGEGPPPDATTLCKFRHILEENNLAPKMLRLINKHLKNHGVKVSQGTIVDATIIHAPSSTKNDSGMRDPEMHQTKKGNEWFFGMKAHIGIDSASKMVHSFAATAANVHDGNVLPSLLRGSETCVWGDAAYRGKKSVIRTAAPGARDFTARHSFRSKFMTDRERETHSNKSRVRSKVEHVFFVVKRIFGFQKVRYRGLAKNAHRLLVNFALANLYLHRRRFAY
jgi:IS5 family transposase